MFDFMTDNPRSEEFEYDAPIDSIIHTVVMIYFGIWPILFHSFHSKKNSEIISRSPKSYPLSDFMTDTPRSEEFEYDSSIDSIIYMIFM